MLRALLHLRGLPNDCQFGFARSVALWAWYGGMPPAQLNERFGACREADKVIGAAGVTTSRMVALAERPPGSVALTVKMLVPAFGESGVPESAPFPATASHEGPLTLL